MQNVRIVQYGKTELVQLSMQSSAKLRETWKDTESLCEESCEFRTLNLFVYIVMTLMSPMSLTNDC